MAKHVTIFIAASAVAGESHDSSASWTTGVGEAAVLTAGVVVVELAGVSIVKGRLLRWNIKYVTYCRVLRVGFGVRSCRPHFSPLIFDLSLIHI